MGGIGIIGLIISFIAFLATFGDVPLKTSIITAVAVIAFIFMIAIDVTVSKNVGEKTLEKEWVTTRYNDITFDEPVLIREYSFDDGLWFTALHQSNVYEVSEYTQ